MLLFTNLFKRDSDPHSEKLPDPDPQKMKADPQPCLCPNFFGKFEEKNVAVTFVVLQVEGAKKEFVMKNAAFLLDTVLTLVEHKYQVPYSSHCV